MIYNNKKLTPSTPLYQRKGSGSGALSVRAGLEPAPTLRLLRNILMTNAVGGANVMGKTG